MLTFAFLALLASAVMAYVIGMAVIAPRDSFLRTKAGVWLLIFGAISLILLPPQLILMEGIADSMLSGMGGGMSESVEATAGADAVGGVAGMLAWPAGISKGLYIGLWIVTSLAALLIGMRIWKARQPGWRSGTSNAMDNSTVGRVRSLLPLADSLGEALDAMARANLDPRSTELLAGEIRAIGRRFAVEVPEGSAATYNMVVKVLSPSVANVATKYLLEGVAERRQAEAGDAGSADSAASDADGSYGP